MGFFTSSGAAVDKAGINVSTSIPEKAFNAWASGAEATINVATRKNWSPLFTDLNSAVRDILSDTSNSLVAIEAIKYDMSGYTSRGEAESMVNILRDGVLRNISFLRDKKSEDFINGA